MTSVASFVEFARETSATLCCLNVMLWEAYLRLVSGRAAVKQFLCCEYYRRKAEIYQELFFSCHRDRCSCVLSTKGCLTGAYSGLARVIREFKFPAVVPRLDVFCPEVDECPTRPVIVFEENYDRFSELCPLCGLGQEREDSVLAVHAAPSNNAAHRSGRAACSAVTYTPMLFADWHDGCPPVSPPTRRQPDDTDSRAYTRFLKLKVHANVFGSTNWIMSEPEFVNVVHHTLVFRQLQGSSEGIDRSYRSPEPIHFVVFVNGLGGRSSDFFWAKKWMKLLIGTSKHIMIWSEANEKEETFEEIAVCGARLALEVTSFLDNIGTKNFKLSFVGFSLGCVLVRAALTCATMSPYIKNLHTFLSLNGPHLGVLYAKSKLLKFQISILSRIKMKGSIKELTFQDSMDIRKCYLYILSQAPGIEYFKNVLLVGSSQDKLVPVHSSNIQHCPNSLSDTTVIGKAYDEMLKNLLGPLLKREDVTLKRFDIFYDTGRLRYLEPVCVSLSHVGALMSRNLFERLMLLSPAEYFK
ncbi:protein FAM135B-like [Haemaphysalis longicornis]